MSGKKKAAALKYNFSQQEGAPNVIAVGEGYVAEKIIGIAREFEVPIIENVEVVSKLVRMSPDTEIPPELYEAAARILAFIYRIENNIENRGNE